MALNGLTAANNLGDAVNAEEVWDNIGDGISAIVSVPPLALDLNFIKNKSLIDDVSGNNLITFSRASTGTFVGSNGLLQTAASGISRFDHNPTTGESLGLLVEEARTNSLTYSEDTSQWNTPINITLTQNQTTAPSGTLTADQYLETAATGLHAQENTTFTFVTSTVYTYSVFAKSIGGRNFEIGYPSTLFTGRFARFTLSGSGSVQSSDAGVTASIQAYPDGWYRCSATSTCASGASSRMSNFIIDGSFARSYAGDVTKGLFVWGAQLEAGSFPTSYIPTVASTVTRAADLASITGSNFSSWFNPVEGTINIDYRTGLKAANTRVFQINDGSLINNIDCVSATSTGTGGAFLITVNSVQYGSGGSVEIAARLNTIFKITGAYKENYVATANNQVGRLYAEGDTPLPSGLNQVTFGQYNFSNLLCGHIRRVTYWPIRLPNITVLTLATSDTVSDYQISFSIKGKDIFALQQAKNTSARDFIFIKGLTSAAQPRITIAAQQAASGTVLRDAAMLKASPTTIGNYFFSSGITLSGVSTRINGTPALSIDTFPFSGSTATASILLGELRPQTNWRITEPMASGTIASPGFAIPFETNDFVLFMKAGQN